MYLNTVCFFSLSYPLARISRTCNLDHCGNYRTQNAALPLPARHPVTTPQSLADFKSREDVHHGELQNQLSSNLFPYQRTITELQFIMPESTSEPRSPPPMSRYWRRSILYPLWTQQLLLMSTVFFTLLYVAIEVVWHQHVPLYVGG